MIYVIKRGSDVLIEIKPTGSQKRQAMGVNMVEMNFTLHTPIDFDKGDWCMVYGEKYVLFTPPTFKKINERRYDYDLKLVHEFYGLQNIKYKGLDSENEYNLLRFSLTGNAASHMNLLVQNANLEQSGWTVGVVDNTISKTISYSGENLLQVLNRLASEFETEYWIENKTIHLAKRTGDSGIVLGYGKGKGFISLTKGNKDDAATIFTRLYAEGGNRNIPSGYRYGAKSLMLPIGTPYVNDVGLEALYGVVEEFVSFDDIYPKRLGTITDVTDELTFTDSGIDFDVNAQLMPNISAKCIFQTGLLAGYTFELNSFNNSTKTFVINEIDEPAITGGKLPTASLKPNVGDTYILVDIVMPSTYITNAENDLLTAAQAHFAKGSDISYNDKYSGDCDPIFFKTNAIDLHDKLGFTANIKENTPLIDVDKRMSSISRNLQNPWKYEIEFTDKIELSAIARKYAENKKTSLIIYGTDGFSGAGGGGSSFLSQLSGNGGYLYLSGTKVKAGYADLAEEAVHAYTADSATESDKSVWVQSADYVSGFAGAGHRLKYGILEADTVIVRKELSAYTLNIKEVTGVGGSFAVTNVGKIKTVTVSGSDYVCEFDTDEGTIYNPFAINDIVKCKIDDSQKAKYYLAKVKAVTGTTFTLEKIEGAGVPEIGDKLFQFGNTSNAARQGLIYMTNTDSGAPYLDVLDGVNSASLSGKTKVRLGKLDGITDAAFPTNPTGYGLYGSNVFLKGVFQITGGNGATKTYADDAANNAIATLADDNKLSPLEKQQLAVIFNGIASEVEDLKTQATQVGVSSTNYNNAWTALNAYVSPLLTDLSTESTIAGAIMRTKFSDYYTQRSLLVKAIQNANYTTDNTLRTWTGENDAVVKAKAGNSIWQGGYLKTNLIEAAVIVADGGGQKFNSDNPTGKQNAGDTWIPSSTVTRDGTTFTAGKRYVCIVSSAGWNSAYWKEDTEVYTQSTYPYDKTTKVGAIWIDTANGNIQKTWDGTYWVTRQDNAISTAQTTANTASTNATNAQSAANTANTNATNAQSTANTANTNATNAQTTANSKSTTFTAMPDNYKVGDLLIPFATFTIGGTQFKAGELYTATAASASFNKSHWVKKVNYTDDTTANDALAVANSRGQSTIGLLFPSNPKIGDLHFETSGRKWWKWSGSAWVDTGMVGLNYLYEALALRSEITGGLILSHVMGVKNESGVVTSYMNGLAGSNGIAFAAGVANFAEVSETQTTAIFHNGDILVKKSGVEKLKFVASTGELSLTGLINATGGTIGGFTIDGQTLKTNPIQYNTQSLILDGQNNIFKFYSGKITTDGNNTLDTSKPDIVISTSGGEYLYEYGYTKDSSGNVNGNNSILSTSSGFMEFNAMYYDTNYNNSISAVWATTTVSGKGVFSNGSGVKMFAGSTGIDSNSSIVGILTRRCYSAFSPYGISSAVTGLDHTDNSHGNSASFGGYFNRAMVGSLHMKIYKTSSSTYYTNRFDGFVEMSGSGNVYLSSTSDDSHFIWIKNTSGSDKTIYAPSGMNINNQNGSATGSVTIANGRCFGFVKSGSYWLMIGFW